MPGVRPDSIGPVWGVTAWRTSTRVVGRGGAGAAASGAGAASVLGSELVAGGAVVTNRIVPGTPRADSGGRRRQPRSTRGLPSVHERPTDRIAPRRTPRDRAPGRPVRR